LRNPPAPVCILLPVLNEVEHVQALWTRIVSAMGVRPFHVCFVDDGSRDGTVEMLRRLERADSRVHLIARTKRHRGSQRGSALHTAMLWGLQSAEHAVFVEMDGDLSHRPEELPSGLSEIDSGRSDVAIASKYLGASRVTNRPVGRRVVSFVCNLIVRALLSTSVHDYSNGYRFYSRKAAALLAETEIRYGSPIYLSEAMAIWLASGLRVSEFPTLYEGRHEGISKLRKRDLAKAAIAVFEIALRYRVGFSAKRRERSVRPDSTIRQNAEPL
jgi:dolichol-phosphate mannosyltransferase